MRNLRDLQSQLGTTAEAGLPSPKVAAAREQYGSNRLTPLPKEPLWKKFLGKFDEPIIKILLAAALLSMFVDLFQMDVNSGGPVAGGVVLALAAAAVTFALLRGGGQWVPSILFGTAVLTSILGFALGHPLVEGLAVMIAVILATGVAFIAEYQSDREFEILNAQKDSIQVKLIRDGQFQTVPLEEVVVGDLVKLEVGDEIPADGRVVAATEMMVDQSLMTGESEPVKKLARPDDTSDGPSEVGCVYRGTQVVDGIGAMVVTEVGDHTYLGQIARRLSPDAPDDDEEEKPEGEPQAGSEEERIRHKLTISKALTPLQVKLTALADLISNVGYIAAVAIFLAMLVRGLFVGEVGYDAGMLGSLKALLSYFVYMVIIIVVAVPEGLPMSVTVSLAMAMRKMTKANSLVRQLVACETIGSATVICSDKTGTLTQNKMTVERFFLAGQLAERNTPQWPKPASDLGDARTPIDWVALNSAVNATANLENKDGKVIVIGSTTEGALLSYLRENGVAYEPLRNERFPEVYQVHFSSERKKMTSVIRHGGHLVTLVKGAAEIVLEKCTHYLAADGIPQPMTPEARRAIDEALRDAASREMRALGFAHAILPAGTPETEEGLHERRDDLEQGLIFDGFVAIRDPIRDDVKEAVERCRDAGIEVKMITGDNVITARAIAFDIGLIDSRDAAIDTPSAKILTSDYFNKQYDLLRTLRGKAQPTPDEQQRIGELTAQLSGLRVLARARPLDKHKMVELLQAQDQVVAMTGDGTNDAPALKKADVGLAMGIAGTEVAKEASKIVLLDDAFSTIVKATHWGRALYENIQRFIQFQLTINVSALLIAFLGPFLGVRPPFTVLQLLWINVIMDTFAAIALCSEPPRAGLMRQKPKRKDENIVTPQMAYTIFVTAGFFLVVMLTLLLGMKNGGWFDTPGSPRSEEFTDLSVRQVSIFYTVYIFFQVWNLINCRSLTPEQSGLVGLGQNPMFLMIAGLIVLMQVVLVMWEPLAAIFKVGPLGAMDWLWIVAGTASVLVFAEIARRVRLAMNQGSATGGR